MRNEYNRKKRVLDVLNSLEVVEENGGEDAYIIVDSSEGNIGRLNAVGVSTETIYKYGDENAFCILALALSEKIASGYEDGKLVYKDERTLEELKSEIQVLLDSPITDFNELHEAIQDRLESY